MKPPFPWFGGKSRVAPLVWERFGDVATYIEPFESNRVETERSKRACSEA